MGQNDEKWSFWSKIGQNGQKWSFQGFGGYQNWQKGQKGQKWSFWGFGIDFRAPGGRFWVILGRFWGFGGQKTRATNLFYVCF